MDAVEAQGPESLSPGEMMWRRFRRSPSGVVGLIITVLLILTAVFAPQLTSHDPVKNDLRSSLQGPSLVHPLGTDQLGRDVLTRVLWGSRISLSVGLVVQSVALTLGTALGLAAGYLSRRVDAVIMSITNAMLAFPYLLFAIAIMSVLGPGLYNVFLALGILAWPRVCRLVRGEVLALKEREFVEAGRAAGAGPVRIMARHLLPNCLDPLIVYGTLGVATAILAEASLSFLGLGAQPPSPSWGSMIGRGRDYIFTAPWMIVAPGVAIFITVLGLNLLGDAVRDVLDPRLKK
ncbi:MAG: ABC transporter permease [Bacillota bacterium]